MRFLLDNDVDATLVGLLVRSGHESWTAAQAGLAGVDAAKDDEVSVYAQDREAVVITHDDEFTRRRIRNTYGRHVQLKCEQPDAETVLGSHLDEVVELLETMTECVVLVGRDSVRLIPPSWD